MRVRCALQLHPLEARCASAGASQATMHRRYATVSLIAACVQGLTLPGDYASAASKLAGTVRTVSSVGCGDIEGVEEDTIVVEGTTATMVAADAVGILRGRRRRRELRWFIGGG